MISVLNLDLIVDDRRTGIHCTSAEQVAELVSTIKLQRPDVDVSAWFKVDYSRHMNNVFFLNYSGAKALQTGSMSIVESLGLGFVPFEELVQHDLPEINANETGILSLLGL